MQRWHRFVYGAFGVFWVGAGLYAAAGFTTGTPDEVHVTREAGAGLAFVGWMHLWCLRNDDRRLPVHLGLLVFAALFSAIHWREYAVGARTILSPLVNSVPLIVLAAMLPDRARTNTAPDRPPDR